MWAHLSGIFYGLYVPFHRAAREVTPIIRADAISLQLLLTILPPVPFALLERIRNYRLHGNSPVRGLVEVRDSLRLGLVRTCEDSLRLGLVRTCEDLLRFKCSTNVEVAMTFLRFRRSRNLEIAMLLLRYRCSTNVEVAMISSKIMRWYYINWHRQSLLTPCLDE